MTKSWAARLVQVTGSAACQSKNFLLLRYLKSLIYNSVAELRYTIINGNMDKKRTHIFNNLVKNIIAPRA